MARGYPQFQTRAVLQEKAALVHRLLGSGLTVQQISTQLRCSYGFVQRIKRQLQDRAEEPAGSPQDQVIALRAACDTVVARVRRDGTTEETARDAERALVDLVHDL